MLRTALLVVISTLLALYAAERTAPLVVEDLHGAWVVNAKAVTAEQAAAATAAAAVEDYGVNFTQRTCRVILSNERAFAGMWRLDAATATTATVVIQPKGGEEQRLAITFDGKTLVLIDAPGKLPLIKAKR